MLGSRIVVQAYRQAAKQSASSRSTSIQTFGTEALLASASRYPTAAVPQTPAPLTLARIRELAQLYKQLSKAKLSLLVVSTAAAGFVAGSGEAVDWSKLCWTSVGTMAAASSANALNQIYEVSNDALMKRTARRPLPTGKLSVPHALAFAGIMGAGGIAILASTTNNLTAGLGAANIALYAAVYTPLKVVSIANTWVGAVVGAIPPLMGWAAASGQLQMGSLVLASTLYFWQMPHFMALAWLCREDYARGGYQMLSRLDPTGRRTAACALRNCLYLLPVGMLAAAVGLTSNAFAYESAFVSGAMTLSAAAFYSSPTNAAARALFKASLVHLPLFLAALLVHRIPQTQEHAAQFHVSLAPPVRSFASAPVHSQTQQSDAVRGALRTVCVAPFPFLPLPMESSQWSSPEVRPIAASKDSGL